MPSFLKWLLGILAVAVVVVVITVPLVLLTRQETPSGKTYTLQNYVNNDYKYKTHNLEWISGNQYLHKTDNGNILCISAENGTFTLILANTTLDKYQASTVILSPDLKFALLQYSYTKVQVHFTTEDETGKERFGNN